MNIEAFLEDRADAVLRETPAGDYVADILEVLLGDTINTSDKCDALLGRVKAMPDQAVAGRVLYRNVPDGLMAWDSWSQLTDTASNSPEAKRRMMGLRALVAVVSIMTLAFGGLLLYEYAVNKVQPSVEQYGVVFGPMFVISLLLMGMRAETLKGLVQMFTGRRG